MAQDEVRKVEAERSATRSTIHAMSTRGLPRSRLDFRPPGLSHRVARNGRDTRCEGCENRYGLLPHTIGY